MYANRACKFTLFFEIIGFFCEFVYVTDKKSELLITFFIIC